MAEAPKEKDLTRARKTLVRAVKAAGELQRAGAKSVVVESKGERDVVTDVDRRCEAAVAQLLRAAHPNEPILAEEGAGHREPATNGPLWVLDPLDGTKNYAHGLPRFSCSLALLWNGEPLLGAVYTPLSDELFLAEKSRGATLNGSPIGPSKTASLSSALVGTSLTVRSEPSDKQIRRVAKLVESVQAVRVGGCASLDLCDVARGRLDAYFEEGLSPWDTAAGTLIVREAGGVVTTFSGNPHQLFGPETLAATRDLGLELASALRDVA